MSAKEGVVVLNDEKEEQRGGDPFDIFSLPEINNDYEKCVDIYVEPLSHITQNGPIVFKWETLGGEKWDSSKLEIETTYTVMKGAAETEMLMMFQLSILCPLHILIKLNSK